MSAANHLLPLRLRMTAAYPIPVSKSERRTGVHSHIFNVVLASPRRDMENRMKVLAATVGLVLMLAAMTIGLALTSPSNTAMTIECRDLTFGARLEKLSVSLDQRRAAVS